MGRSPYDPKNDQSTADYGLRPSQPSEPPRSLSPDEMIGRTISGKYKLLRSIGQGGMGTIFEAEHAFIGNRVAVKLLHENFAARREPVQRLYREARATGAIGHPNIITVHDVGESEDGIPYLVMELLKGQSLGELLQREGRLGLRFVLEMTIQMLSALAAAHESGVIHRDLKSDNVFLTQTEEGQIHVKLLDFGISKFSAPDHEVFKLTQTGSVLGTPYYMSPEQAAGRRDPDHRIDLYAAGVILYEVLTGKLPHSATNYNALINEIINKEIQPFRWQRPEIPNKLEKAVLKALSRNRDDRWLRAIDFMEELALIRDQLSSLAMVKSTIPPPEPNPWDKFEVNTQNLRESKMRVEFEDTPMGFETEDRMRGSTRMALWAAMTAIPLAIVVGVFFFFVRGPAQEPTPQGFEPSDEIGVSKKSALEEESDSASRAVVLLQVHKTPPQAVVRFGNQIVGESGIEIPRGTEPVTLLAQADGYQTKTFRFNPVGDARIDVALEPVPPASSPPTPPKAAQAVPKRRKRGTRRAKPDAEMPRSKKSSVPPESSPLDRPMDNPF